MITAEQVDAEQELASLCGVLNASYSRLVAIVADALLDESWAIAGIRSPEHWLTIRAGLAPFRARQIVQVARRRAELPSVMSEFADGQLSLDQVLVVARYAPAHVEASVAELAIHASVPQLRRALSQYSFDPPAEPGHTQGTTTRDATTRDATTGPDDDTSGGLDSAKADGHDNDTSGGLDSAKADGHDDDTAGGARAGDPPGWNGFALIEDRAAAPAELSLSYDHWGRFTMRFSAPADVGALVEAALAEAKDALFRAGRPQVTMGDAMAQIAQTSLGAVESINRRDAYRTYVHLDTEGGWLTGKPRLPVHLVDKLTCDGVLQPVWHTQGAPVNVGRAQRIVPTRTRRLVEDRDRGCRFPGCPATAYVECHHLVHWVDGGPTDTWNLCSLCPFHHDGHHVGDFTIAGNADDPAGLTFTTKQGFPIRPGPTFTTPTGSPCSPAPPGSSDPTKSSGPTASSAPPGSLGSTASSAPPGSSGSVGSSPPGTPSGVAPYRGPSGDTLSLRWLSFGPSEPAAFPPRPDDDGPQHTRNPWS